jgi:hypothetical protein
MKNKKVAFFVLLATLMTGRISLAIAAQEQLPESSGNFYKVGELKPESPVYHCNASLMVEGTNVLAKLLTLQNYCALVTSNNPEEMPYPVCAHYINGKNSSSFLRSVGLPNGTWNATVNNQQVQIEVQYENAEKEGALVYVKQVGLGHDYWNLPTDIEKQFLCYPAGALSKDSNM